MPVYPNTPPQDSVVSGQINGAPFSNYLHIHDATTTSVSNANWNSNNASDRFAFLGRPFCTLGMTNVIFTFFWICQGTNDAYGEVYYRVNGGPWIKTGQAKYNNQSRWKYEVIQDPAFNNVQNLQLGFRWVNPASGVPSNISFGIDDIIAVGTYDNLNNPVTLSINLISPLTVCQDNFLTIGYSLSAPLCDAIYQIEMSDRNGNFSNPYNGGVFNIFAPDTSGFIGFQVPRDSAGTCFKIRIRRLNPEPQIVGTASVCFTIQNCPETVITNNAPVMNDADTTCILSVIDVKFNSIGVFLSNNVYIAELSNSSGSFANPYFLGSLPSRDAYPGPPGNISGLIPQNVPPGCGYYIRVRATSPATTGTTIGPFCLVQCDEHTNNHQDLHFCVPSGTQPYPNLCDTLVIHPNEWNNQASYDTCNNWTIELRSMMDFSLVNSGGLGVYHDSIGGNFVLCVPPYKALLPVPPGAYYMRIVSNCSSQPWNQTGSVIRITIGAPDTIPPIIILEDTVECNLGIVSLTVSPFNRPPSDYEWASNGLNNTQPFIWPYNPLLVNFTNAPIDDYYFTVREINFGCYGPYSARATLSIIGIPDVGITGDTVVCLGDTVTYNVGYLKETYYNWDGPSGVKIFDEGNSQVTMIFDTIGTFTISNYSLNACGGDSGYYTVKVITPYSVYAGEDSSLCAGEPITLNAEAEPYSRVFVTKDTTTTQGRQGAMFNIIAHDDVVIDSFAVKYLSTTQLVQQEIYGKSGSYRSFEQTPLSWNQLGSYWNFPANPPAQFTVIPIQVNQSIAAGDTFAFYITTINNPTAVNMQYSPGTGTNQGVVFKSDGVIDFVQGTANNYSFGAFIGPRVLNTRIYYTTKAGLKFLWNTGDTTATIITAPEQTGAYTVIVYDSSGCKSADTVLLTVKPSPAADAGPDTSICKGETYQINASSSTTDFYWHPPDGLSDDSILNPLFDYPQTMQYVLNAKGINGCVRHDSLKITVNTGPALDAGPDTALCNGGGYVIPAVSSSPDFMWTPATGLDNPADINPTFISSQSTTYILSASDTTGCINRDTVAINVGAAPTVYAGPDADVCDNDPYIIPATSTGQIFVWSPSAGLSDTTILNPAFFGVDSGEYLLVVSDLAGCKASDSVKLKVVSCYLKVPQAFTPNSDGTNDFFTVFGVLDKYEIRIFNRWGEMVYYSNNAAELCDAASDCQRGWDGTYKGKPQELGTFVYYINGKDFNGKNIEKKGNLTLIR